MTNPNDPSGPPYGEQPDPTQPPADPGHSPASPPAWQQQQPPAWPPQQPQEQPQQPPNQGWEQQPGWGQQPPPPPGGWPPPPPPQQQQPQGAPAWDQPTQSIGWSQPQQQAWDQQAPQPTQVWGQEQPWGQQQQGWQPPGYPGAQPPSTRSRSTLPLIVIGAVVLILAVVGVLGFVAPGFFVKKVFDSGAVQTGVTTVLTSDYKLSNVTNVTCPAQQEVKVGATFTCTASVDGRNRTVPITVKTTDGSYEVGRPT